METLIAGLLLPLRAYIQPRRLLIDTVTAGSESEPALVYLWSLLWIPLAGAAGWVAFGGALPLDTAWVVILLSLAFAGTGWYIGDRMRMRNNQDGQSFFNAGAACQIGVWVNVAFILDMLLLSQIAQHNGLDVARVVDSPTLDYPSMFILGGALGIILSGVLSLFQPRGLIVSFAGPGLFLLLLAATPNPDLRLANMTAAATTLIMATHIVFQPLYVLISALLALLLRLNPEAAGVLWKLSPAHWSDMTYLPLPGVSALAETLYRQDQQAGIRAVVELKFHPFYSATGARLETKLRSESGPA